MFDVSYMLVTVQNGLTRKKVRKRKKWAGWPRGQERGRKRKERTPLWLDRSTRMAGTPSLFLLLGILLPFSLFPLGKEYGDRIRLLSSAELAAPWKGSSVCFFSFFLPHSPFLQPMLAMPWILPLLPLPRVWCVGGTFRSPHFIFSCGWWVVHVRQDGCVLRLSSGWVGGWVWCASWTVLKSRSPVWWFAFLDNFPTFTKVKKFFIFMSAGKRGRHGVSG